MNWRKFRTDALNYRMEYHNTEEYVAILLLGIAEELAEYRASVYSMHSVEKQLNEYGDLLWNIAELENVLSENHLNHCMLIDAHVDSIYDVSLNCVQSVRKHYLRNKNDDVLLSNARDILTACRIFFVNSESSKPSMVANCKKMKARFRSE